MAKTQAKPVRTKAGKTKVEWKFPLEKKNFMIFGAGIATIALGYILMTTGLGDEYALTTGAKWNNPLAVNVAPVLLVIGYCGLIPYSIYKYFGADAEATNEQEN